MMDIKKYKFYKNLNLNDKKNLKTNDEKIFFKFSPIFINDLASFKSKLNNTTKCYNIFEDNTINYLNSFTTKKKNLNFEDLPNIFVGENIKKKKIFSVFKKKILNNFDILDIIGKCIIDGLHMDFSFSRILIKIFNFLVMESNNNIETLNELYKKFNIKFDNIEGETIENLLKDDFNKIFFEILNENSKFNKEDLIKLENIYYDFLKKFKNFYEKIWETKELTTSEVNELHLNMDFILNFIKFFSSYTNWSGYYLMLFNEIVMNINKYGQIGIFNLVNVEQMNKKFKKIITKHQKFGGSINKNWEFKKILSKEKIKNDNTSQMLLNILFLMNIRNNEVDYFCFQNRKYFKDNDFKNENEFKYFNLYETNENGEIIEKNLDVYSEKINKILNGDKKKKLKEDINLIIEYKKKLKIDLNFLDPNKNSFPLKNLNENEEIKNYLKTNQIGAINFFEKNIIEKNIKNNLLIGGPGSGKTIVYLILCILILNKIKNSKIIIVSPKSNLFNIKNEYKNFCKKFNIMVCFLFIFF
jgi:hypothetical protein